MSESPAEPGPARPVRQTIYLESRYRKLQRGLPQTIFWCPACKGDRRRRQGCAKCAGYGKLTRESVQELVGRRALPAFQAKTGSFHGAGREDVDVLMLGRGRPFVYEVTGARNPEVDLEALRQEIVARAAGAIELAPFTVVRRERVVYWKETHFDKIYRAEVVLGAEPAPERLAALASFGGTIVQRTPQRVAHRRADRDRQRSVRVCSVRLLGPLQLELRIQCQHGTYVKEWVSGDETRTSPSLATLLAVSSQCALLDVEEILTDDIPGERLPVPDSGPAELPTGLQERRS